MKTFRASRTGLHLAGLVAVLLAFALVTPGQASANEPAPRPGTAQFEIKFMSDMIDHHAMAIEMGTVCLDKAVHDELKELCADIVSTQQQEIETLQGWLESWYGVSYEPEMTPGDMKKVERLASLSGAEFEIEFMEMMSKHHARAIKMATRCLDRADHEELLALCDNIVATQSAEIQQMSTWLCDWYGICRPEKRA
jgi:uncharacterized protein (DUF305 family)